MSIKYTSYRKKVKSELKDKRVRALSGVGEVVRTWTAERAPKDTGHLANSYVWGLNEKQEYVDIGSTVKYAPAQEFGTRRMKAQPHLKPSLYDKRLSGLVEKLMK